MRNLIAFHPRCQVKSCASIVTADVPQRERTTSHTHAKANYLPSVQANADLCATRIRLQIQG